MPPTHHTQHPSCLPSAHLTTCPSCQKTMYFYRGPQGAVGYFNLWGPPWPAHPCQSGRHLRDIVRERKHLPRPRAAVDRLLMQDEWMAMQCQATHLVPEVKEASLVQGHADGQSWHLYVRCTGLSSQAPCHVLNSDGQMYFSTLVEIQQRILPVSLPAYTTLDALTQSPVSDPPPKPKQPRQAHPGAHELTRLWNLSVRRG